VDSWKSGRVWSAHLGQWAEILRRISKLLKAWEGEINSA